jgi:hypothetical protein
MKKVESEKPRDLHAKVNRDVKAAGTNESNKTHLDELLDEALRESFSASDTTSISVGV